MKRIKRIHQIEDSTLQITTVGMYKKVVGVKRAGKYKFSVDKIRSSALSRQTVDRINSLKIEVRSSETSHNLPHFHVTSPGKVDAVYTINPIQFYKGNVDSKSNKVILKWAETNQETLITMWNDFHGYRIKVS